MYPSFAEAAILLNEVYIKGTNEWVELLNNGGADVDVQNYKIVDEGGTVRVVTSSNVVPAGGLLVLEESVFNGALTFLDTTDTITLLDSADTGIGSVAYGGVGEPAAPTSGQSLLLGTPYTVGASSKGWFNNATPGGNPPLVSDITTIINNSGITTNMGSMSDMTHVSGLYFEKTGYGKVTFSATLNLTDSTTVSFLQDLGNRMPAMAESLKFDAHDVTNIKNAGAEVKIYNLNFAATPSITVRDDSNNIIATSSLDYPSLTGITYSGGTLTFNTNHFSRFDTGGNHNPVLASISNQTVNEFVAATFTASATDVDSDAITYSLSGAPSRRARGNPF
jgi:hypothetical protein